MGGHYNSTNHSFLTDRYFWYCLITSFSPVVYQWWSDVILHHYQQEQQEQQRQQQSSFQHDPVEDPHQHPQSAAASLQPQPQSVIAHRRQWQLIIGLKKALDLILPLTRLALLWHVWQQPQTTGSTTTTPTDLVMWLLGLSYQGNTTATTTTAATSTPSPSTAAAAAAATSSPQQPQQQPPPPPRLQILLAHRRYFWEVLIQVARLWILDGLVHVPTLILQPMNDSFQRMVQTLIMTMTRKNSWSLNSTSSTSRCSRPNNNQPSFPMLSTARRCPVCHTVDRDMVIPMQTTNPCSQCHHVQTFCYTCLYSTLLQQQQQQQQQSGGYRCGQCGKIQQDLYLLRHNTNPTSDSSISGAQRIRIPPR